MTSQARVVLLGTDPRDPRGGIGVAMSGFRQVLEEEGLLHAHVPTYDPSSRLRVVRRAAGAVRPMLRAIREIRRGGLVPVVYTHAGGPVSILRETSMLRIARLAGARTMLQLHAVSIEDLLAHPLGRPALQRLAAVADRIGVLSPYWKRVADEGGIGPTAVVPNPLPPWAEDEARRPLLDRPAGPLRVLCMTRLVAGKGVDLAIDAMRWAPEGSRLVVAGSGPEQAALAERARGLPVELVGWVEGERKQQLFAESDLFLLPTRYDAVGMGFLEAAAWGLPSVALRFKAIPDMVAHGETGMLVDDPDPRQIGRVLTDLGDSARRREMGARAKARALELFSRAAVGEKLREALPRG